MQPSYDTHRVRQRAYEIWLAEGMTSGRDLEHWCAAERELVAADEMIALARPKPKARKTSRKTSIRSEAAHV
ncbi:MAG TPA: DUF2934 domain-containing protein [Beijerinckiaceae bacterium]|nr:DUF2934 domain-containing protein [Beijerinckiaceae bacterium]